MENKFTPGPWEVIRYNDLQYSIYNQGEGYVEKDISDEEDIANEKLIAAAPELYEAVACFMSDYYNGKKWDGGKAPLSLKIQINPVTIEKLMSALKKATE